jgi:cytochrome P450
LPIRITKSLSVYRLFIQNLEALRNPIPWLIPLELRAARKIVRQKIEQCVENGNYGKEKQGVTLFERLAFLYESLEIPREGFTDCHLVAIVGLMSNVINILTWAFCEIVADSELLVSLLAEIEAIVDASSPNPAIDVDQIRCSCPLLVATWYELLRTYGDSPVARGVHEDSVFDNKYQLRKGSIIMTPIHLHNFNIDIWGKDAEIFRPSRFLQKDGEVRQDLVKHLNVFGLPGMHQCPGRYLGMNLTLGMLAKALLTFKFTPTPGEALGRGILPARKDTMLGLPALSRDPSVIVRRCEGIRAVHLNFDNVRPGW